MKKIKLKQTVDVLGSSTACLVVLDKSDKTVHTANIGDSGFLVVREGKILHRSQEQTHYFNTPHQLSQPPPDQTGLVLCDRYVFFVPVFMLNITYVHTES